MPLSLLELFSIQKSYLDKPSDNDKIITKDRFNGCCTLKFTGRGHFMSKILIVEDEKPIREFIAINLKGKI